MRKGVDLEWAEGSGDDGGEKNGMKFEISFDGRFWRIAPLLLAQYWGEDKVRSTVSFNSYLNELQIANGLDLNNMPRSNIFIKHCETYFQSITLWMKRVTEVILSKLKRIKFLYLFLKISVNTELESGLPKCSSKY